MADKSIDEKKTRVYESLDTINAYAMLLENTYGFIGDILQCLVAKTEEALDDLLG